MLAVVTSSRMQAPIVVEVSASDVAQFEQQLGIKPQRDADRSARSRSGPTARPRNDAESGERTRTDRDRNTAGRNGKPANRNVLVYDVSDEKLLKRLLNLIVFKPTVSPVRLFVAQSMMGWLLDRTTELSSSLSEISLDRSAQNSSNSQQQEETLRKLKRDAAQRAETRD